MKYFLFDIGHVLVNFCADDFLREVARQTGKPVEPLSASDLEKINEVEKGEISDTQFVGYLNDTRGVSWTTTDLRTVWSGMFSINEAGHGLYLDALKAGVSVYTLSNIAQHHMDAIEKNWDGFFDGATGLFLSYQIGSRKPDPAIYRHTIDQLGAQGEQCFFIDDRPENVEAAKAEGMQAYQFVPENHAATCAAAKEFFGMEGGCCA